MVVEVDPVVAFKEPVTLAQIKADAALANIALIRRSRLSVVPIEKAEFQHILKLGKTRIPRGK